MCTRKSAVVLLAILVILAVGVWVGLNNSPVEEVVTDPELKTFVMYQPIGPEGSPQGIRVYYEDGTTEDFYFDPAGPEKTYLSQVGVDPEMGYVLRVYRNRNVRTFLFFEKQEGTTTRCEFSTLTLGESPITFTASSE